MKTLLRFTRHGEGAADTQVSVADASDPTAWYRSFEEHWTRAASIMQSNRAVITIDHVDAVFEHLDHVVMALIYEVSASVEPSIGPVLDRFFVDEILSQVLRWVLATPLRFASTCQVRLLKLFENLVVQAHTTQHSMLVHKPILTPLLHLIEWVNPRATENATTSPRRDAVSEVEKHFVLLLNQICVKIAEHDTLLDFFFGSPLIKGVSSQLQRRVRQDNDGASRFIVFTMLVPYLYYSDDVGQLARDALLMVLTVSHNSDKVAEFIALHTDFAAVLATGLSACYSQLPRRLHTADDWCRISVVDVRADSELDFFVSALAFVNGVAQASHPLVRRRLMLFVHDGFLASVMRSDIVENQSEEVVTACAYLELCARTWTEPCLIFALARFLIEPRNGSSTVLDTLVSRLSGTPKMCQVTLALFNTLLSLHCEDIVVALVLRHLMPCCHLLSSQVPHIAETDFQLRQPSKLLALVPKCVTLDKPLPNIESNFGEYVKEANARVIEARRATRGWAFRWDGRDPDARDFRGEDDEDDGEVDTRSMFSRATSLRSSTRSTRVNAYFSRPRHGSSMTTLSFAPLESAAVDLSVLGGDFTALSDDDIGVVDRLLYSDTDSAASTPHYVRKPTSNGFFKLAFDADVTESEIDTARGGTRLSRAPTALSTMTVESDTNNASYVMRGWADVKDTSTFNELLSNVKTSHWSSARSLMENASYIESRFKELTRDLGDHADIGQYSLQYNQSVENEEETTPVANIYAGAVTRPCGVPIDCGESVIAPQLGPFMSALLALLDSFTDNVYFVNLQVTGVLIRLASYPQPLLRSVFCHPSLVFEPSVRSLTQVLSALSSEIDAASTECGQSQFDMLLSRACRYMLSRERRSEATKQSTTHMEQLGFAPARGNSPGAGDAKSTTSSDEGGETARYRYYQHQSIAATQTSAVEASAQLRTRNVVFCAVLLREFIQELSAISLAHATLW